MWMNEFITKSAKINYQTNSSRYRTKISNAIILWLHRIVLFLGNITIVSGRWFPTIILRKRDILIVYNLLFAQQHKTNVFRQFNDFILFKHDINTLIILGILNTCLCFTTNDGLFWVESFLSPTLWCTFLVPQRDSISIKINVCHPGSCSMACNNNSKTLVSNISVV